MINGKRRFFGAAIAAAACFILPDAGAQVLLAAPDTELYAAGCAIVDATSVEGRVTNAGPEPLQIAGFVRYTVIRDMSGPAVQVEAFAWIPPGQSLSVGRAQIPGGLLPGDSCRLDIGGAVRERRPSGSK